MTEAADPTPATRRRAILDAAATVFARDGSRSARVHDIAQQAGVAYGLVYHYFGNRQALLDTVFDESWSAFADDVEGIHRSDRPPRDQLRAVVDYLFGAFAHRPEVVKVVVLEYGARQRSGALDGHPHTRRAIDAIAAMFRQAAARGELRPDLAVEAMPPLFMGAIEGAFATAVKQDDVQVTASLRTTTRALFLDAAFLPRSGVISSDDAPNPPEVPCTSK